MSKSIGKSLIDVNKQFATTEQCLNYLEAMRWPKGVQCLACESKEVRKFSTQEGNRKRTQKNGEVVIVKVPARHLYECRECGKQFTATVGTIFNDSHLPIEKWMLAVALTINAKKGLSAKQLERDLNINYRTAWYLAHRLREAMIIPDDEQKHFNGTVEVDETFIGGKFDKRRKRAPYDKQAVFGALRRGNDTECSKVRTFPIPNAIKKTLVEAVNKTVSASSDMVITDEWKGYGSLGAIYIHETVNHKAKEFVRRKDVRVISTNGVEGFWSLFKRGLVGQYHQISVKHLQRYLDEFTFRFNNREAADIFTMVVIRLLTGLPLTYAALIAEPAPLSVSQESDEAF
jgi:transposase-like protein